MNRIGVFGGTFNPPHKGHELAAKNFCERMKLTKLLLIPSNIPPHKNLAEDVPPSKRLEMCRLAFLGGELSRYNIEVSDIEINRGGRSYTYDTVNSLYGIYNRKDNMIYFLCGTDMFMSIEKWYRYKELLTDCVFVAAARYDDKNSRRALHDKVNEYISAGYKIEIIEDTPLEISSSALRGMLENNSCACVEKYLSSDVYEYIKSEKLYCHT